MSDLEKYITKMRGALDSDEPASGHLKRFSKKLKAQQQPVRRLNFRHALQIAASIAIILASGIVIVKSGKGGSKMAVNPAAEEFQQTKNFYASQVNARYEDIASLPFNSGEEKEMLLEELSEMDAWYQELLRELNANPGDERAMNALIQHYQLKLQVMDQILEQLIQVQNSQTNDYENANI
ncbi:MAG: hypothetical protein P1P82_08375 [Bacteroidales bacterium]|nr:hypothetical protein [Bacteroidales bacterium]MDT8432305.1 hypothetical protein [Bacteroidales bacterium]